MDNIHPWFPLGHWAVDSVLSHLVGEGRGDLFSILCPVSSSHKNDSRGLFKNKALLGIL